MKYVLKTNFDIIFWEKSWPPHSYLTLTWKYPKRTDPKKLSSLVAVKASLKAIPQNHYKTEKTPTLRTSISGCPHLHTGFLGVTVSTHAYLHEHFIFMWHPRLLQEIQLECDRKFHFSHKKLVIMAETSSLAEFFLRRNVTYKLLKQNCKTNLCGNACATENIVLKFTLSVKISLIGCINLYGSKQKYHCFLLTARS